MRVKITLSQVTIAAIAVTFVAVTIGLGTIAGAQTESFSVAMQGLPDNMDTLCRTSPLIVEARVQSVFPATETNPSGRHINLETDFLIRIDRVLKGTMSTHLVIVPQRGGTLGARRQIPQQFSHMELGGHYVLFMYPDEGDNGPHVERGFERYFIASTFAGIIRLDGEGPRVSGGMVKEFREAYDGKSGAAILAEIAQRVDAENFGR